MEESEFMKIQEEIMENKQLLIYLRQPIYFPYTLIGIDNPIDKSQKNEINQNSSQFLPVANWEIKIISSIESYTFTNSIIWIIK